MHDARFVQECEIRDVFDAIELGRVHLGECIQRDLTNLTRLVSAFGTF